MQTDDNLGSNKKQKKEKTLSNRSLSVSTYPMASTSTRPCTGFSAAEFFRDSPWLNVPSHRKADITVEPLYPRLGLLGGAPSKLAALAAARKKKEGDKLSVSTSSSAPDNPVKADEKTASGEHKGTPLSLHDRLATPAKQPKSSEHTRELQAIENGPRSGVSAAQKKEPPESDQSEHQGGVQLERRTVGQQEQPIKTDICAEPSSFAAIIVGDSTRPAKTEPSHSHSQNVDLMQVYGQHLAEAFDFAGPSPDDVVLKAQSSAKGLAIRGKA